MSGEEGVRIEMNPDETAALMDRVRATGTDIRTALTADAISMPPVDKGPLGRAFTDLVVPVANRVDTVVRTIPDAYNEIADVGHQAVQAYREADAAAADVFITLSTD